jgi:hypothetical protein
MDWRMRFDLLILLLSLLLSVYTSHGFQVSSTLGRGHRCLAVRRRTKQPQGILLYQRKEPPRTSSSSLFLSINSISGEDEEGEDDEDDEDDEDNQAPSATSTSTTRRKRLKRKTTTTATTDVVMSVGVTTATTSSSASAATFAEEPRRSTTPTIIPIPDIRDLMLKTTGSSSGSTTTTGTEATTAKGRDNDQPSSSNTAAVAAGGSRRITRGDDDGEEEEDPLAQLLRDVAAMRDSDKANELLSSSSSDNTITSTIRNVLSTIVTVDFFFVCLLFLWFLAGIVGSYGFHDDTVQLAFNGIFQAIVQPALGILMIAALSDAVLKGKDDD